MAPRRISATKRRLIAFGIFGMSALVLFKLSAMMIRPTPSFKEKLAQVMVDETFSHSIAPPIQIVSDGSFQCKYDPKKCLKPKLAVTLTAETLNIAPFVCVNDRRLFEKRNLVKGFNMAVLNEKTYDIMGMHYFNLEESDASLMSFLMDTISHDIVIIVSFGDVAAKLSTHSRDLLQWYGSSAIVDLRSGYSFVFVGQRGLSRGLAIEKLTPLNSDGTVTVSQCVSFPLGVLSESTPMAVAVNRMDGRKVPELLHVVTGRKETVKTGTKLENCGIQTACQNEEIAFSFFSGKNKDDFPRICVNGVFVIDKNLNGAGRGLNIVVIEPKSQQIMRVAQFDTYEKESSDLENFLDQLAPGELIAVVSFDEASSQLSDMAKQLFYELGSSLVRSMKFRASWYFIGQKGITGYSAFEDLNFPSGSDWAKAIDVKTCVPNNLSGRSLSAQLVAQVPRPRNDQRRHFCQKYDGFEEFCAESVLDAMIETVPLNDSGRLNDPIFNIPILVVAGLSMHRLAQSLEAVMAQPGLNPQMVLVAYDVNYPQASELAALFHFKALPINGSTYNTQLLKAIDRLWDLFEPKTADVAIVVEEEVLISPSYLYFMSQLLKFYLADETVATVSAWNINGFADTSSLPSAIYRVEGSAPGLAFMLKRQVYDAQIRDRFAQCCTVERPGEPRRWRLSGSMLIPDVSRARWLPTAVVDSSVGVGGVLLQPAALRLFAHERSEMREEIKIDDVRSLTEKEYDIQLTELIKNGEKIPIKRFTSCKKPTDAVELLSGLFNPTGEGMRRRALIVFYEEHIETLVKLTNCFGLFLSRDSPSNLYKRILRFSMRGHPVLLVPSKSPFYQPS